jgi:N-acetylneuraminic acid mutarotase
LNTVERFNVEEEEWEAVGPLSEAKCSLTATVVNENIYVFGGYVGEGSISHRIELFKESTMTWVTLMVELPFPLEGLGSVELSDDEVLLIGGKGLEGSRRDIIRFTANELEADENTNGEVIG